MSFGFQSVEHFFASVGRSAVRIARAVGPVVAKIDATVEANKPAIEALSNLIVPGSGAVEDAAFALLGKVAHAASLLTDVTNQSGLNLQLDASFVADIKALLPQIEAFAKSQGLVKPAA